MPNELYYRDTVIGELPDGWDRVPVDDQLVEIKSGFACAKKHAVPNGVPHLRPFNVTTDGEVVVTPDTVEIPDDIREDMASYYLDTGDVLFNNTNSIELVGKTGIVRQPMSVAFSNHIYRLRVRNPEQVDPRWVALALRHLQEKGFFAANCRKWIGQAGFNQTELGRVEIPVPSIQEQRRIVARIEALLRELQGMHKLQEEISADCEKLIKAVLAESFGPEERATWHNEAELYDLAEITARQVDPTLPEYRNLPHISSGTIEEGTGNLLSFNTAAEDGMTSNKYHFKPGAILYSKIRPNLRKVTVVAFEGLCSADIYPLRLKNDELLPEFLMWTLLSPDFTSYANSLSGRARIPKLNRKQLFGYEMRFPSKEAQARVSRRLQLVRQEIDDMRAINNSNTDHVKRVEQSILAHAFRGEL